MEVAEKLMKFLSIKYFRQMRQKIFLLGVKSRIVQEFLAYIEKEDLSAFKNVTTIRVIRAEFFSCLS